MRHRRLPQRGRRPALGALRRPRQVDWERQFEAALESFQRNGFVILVDQRQVEGLDEQIVVAPGTEVSFLKLVPLVGG